MAYNPFDDEHWTEFPDVHTSVIRYEQNLLSSPRNSTTQPSSTEQHILDHISSLCDDSGIALCDTSPPTQPISLYEQPPSPTQPKDGTRFTAPSSLMRELCSPTLHTFTYMSHYPRHLACRIYNDDGFVWDMGGHSVVSNINALYRHSTNVYRKRIGVQFGTCCLLFPETNGTPLLPLPLRIENPTWLHNEHFGRPSTRTYRCGETLLAMVYGRFVILIDERGFRSREYEMNDISVLTPRALVASKLWFGHAPPNSGHARPPEHRTAVPPAEVRFATLQHQNERYRPLY